MEHAVLDEHIWLDDLGGDVARRDELSARVGGEVEVFAGGRDVGSTIDKAWAVDGGSVDDVVLQYIPEVSGVARKL